MGAQKSQCRKVSGLSGRKAVLGGAEEENGGNTRTRVFCSLVGPSKNKGTDFNGAGNLLGVSRKGVIH